MSLIAHYPLTGSDAQDYSGNENNGTLNGGVTTGAAGILGETAFEFDGIDDWINAGSNILNSDSDISVTCWVNTTDSSSNMQIVDERDVDFTGYALSVNSGLVKFIVSGPSVANQSSSTTNVSDGNWHFIAGTWEESSVTASSYVDGVLEGQDGAEAVGGSDTSDTVALGQQSGGTSGGASSNNYYTGRVADIRLYQRKLSPPEIQYLYETTQRGQALTEIKTA